MTKPELVYTTYIKTTPQKLWDAITNPEFTKLYWGGNANYSDFKKGAKWHHAAAADQSKRMVVGDVVESVPPKRLVLTWADPAAPADVSRVTFEIEMVSDLVRLDVIHGDFKPGSPMTERVNKGWPLVLSSLKSYLETGKPIDILAVKGPCAPTGDKQEVA